MSGVQGLLSSGGLSAVSNAPKKGDSPRSKGLKQGLFIFLLSFLTVPLVVMATVWIDADPIMVVVSAIILTVGGLLRAVFALLFESAESLAMSTGANTGISGPMPGELNSGADNYLPPQPANWADTNELVPRSVTDETTKLLEKKR